MFVDEVVELVLPPLPPLEKLSARTAVPGTRSNGSLAAPAVAVVTSAIASRPRTSVDRPRIDACMLAPGRLGKLGDGGTRERPPRLRLANELDSLGLEVLDPAVRDVHDVVSTGALEQRRGERASV